MVSAAFGTTNDTVMLNLNWLRVEEVSWQWSVGCVTVPRLLKWYDVTWCGHDVTWRARRDITWHHMTWTWHYVIWHDVTWRGMTWHEVHHVAWHGMTWHDMTWHDVKWRDIMRHNATWRDISFACKMAEILSKNNWNIFRSESYYRRFVLSASVSSRAWSVENTDFLTRLGEWISAVPEPFRMKFFSNV